MYFQEKNTLKNNRYYNLKHTRLFNLSETRQGTTIIEYHLANILGEKF